MPVWLVPLLIKYGIPIVISILDKTGAINWAEKVALKAGYNIVEGAEGLKRYSAPSDYPNAPLAEHAKGPDNGNFNK